MHDLPQVVWIQQTEQPLNLVCLAQVNLIRADKVLPFYRTKKDVQQNCMCIVVQADVSIYVIEVLRAPGGGI
jgi:hypothetical protein